ncbi:hypothetical protein BBA71_11575 [Acetobacter pasteurianus]|nr:hypothetical protein BBA71_11575 [Acetobacter pasteurianus]
MTDMLLSVMNYVKGLNRSNMTFDISVNTTCRIRSLWKCKALSRRSIRKEDAFQDFAATYLFIQ